MTLVLAERIGSSEILGERRYVSACDVNASSCGIPFDQIGTGLGKTLVPRR